MLVLPGAVFGVEDCSPNLSEFSGSYCPLPRQADASFPAPPLEQYPAGLLQAPIVAVTVSLVLRRRSWSGHDSYPTSDRPIRLVRIVMSLM
jgi:hypothetical protein